MTERGGVGRAGEIPQPDAGIVTAGRQDSPVLAERHRVDSVCGIGEELAEPDRVRWFSKGPQTDLVAAASSHDLPVRAERHRVDGVCGAGDELAEPGGMD